MGWPRRSPTSNAEIKSSASFGCHGWDSNPVVRNYANLSRRRDMINVAQTVGTAQMSRAVAAWVRIPPVSPGLSQSTAGRGMQIHRMPASSLSAG